MKLEVVWSVTIGDKRTEKRASCELDDVVGTWPDSDRCPLIEATLRQLGAEASVSEEL